MPYYHPGIATATFQYTVTEDDDVDLLKTPENYVPAGTFARAVLLMGADANASVNGQSDTTPILLRILDEGILPNGGHSKLKGCVVIASIYGDISSERGEVRLQHISCVQPSHQIMSEPVEGTVSFLGREGIRGIPVMRNGKILWYAGVSGVFQIGCIKQAQTTQNIYP